MSFVSQSGSNTQEGDRPKSLSEIIIWDQEGQPIDPTKTTLLWSSFEDPGFPNSISIPRLVEKDADALKERYLAWVYDLGEMVVDGKRLVDHLQIRRGFSYWWMTQIVEKCNFSKSCQIDDAIKLMVFDTWAGSHPIERLRFFSANEALAKTLKVWCIRVGVGFKWKNDKLPKSKVQWRRCIYQRLPATIKAVVWLTYYLIERWPLRGEGVEEWQTSKAKITFVSYLFNLAPRDLTQNRFESPYWSELPNFLRKLNYKTAWLHLYEKDSVIKSVRQAAQVLNHFNRTAKGKQVHVAIESFLCIRVLLATVRDWFHIMPLSKPVEKHTAQVSSNGLILWPLFETEWRDSIQGPIAIKNLLYLNLFEKAMKILPRQSKGVYLQENQGWEFGLLQAWKSADQGQIIGCPHSTVRYWDLRYFFDPRSYNRTLENQLPMPDKVAVNGAMALQAYRDGGYPDKDLVEVEALRYLHLNQRENDFSNQYAIKRHGLRLLVLGDYTARYTELQMRLLEEVSGFLLEGTKITVKPHPNYPIKEEDYPLLPLTVTMEPINRLLPQCDVAFTSAVTSAAVDAFCMGISVISVLDYKALNLSPLRGQNGVQFVNTSIELALAIEKAATLSRDPQQGHGFFCLDPELPRWKALLMKTGCD